MKKILLYTATCLVFGLNSCYSKSSEKQLQCLQAYIDSTSKLPVYTEVRTAVIDSCEAWVARELHMEWYTMRTNILDSAVFFNHDYSKCLFLLIQLSPPDTQYRFDNVQMFGAEKINEKWCVYTASFPTLGYNIKYNNFKGYTDSFLSKDSRLYVIDQGFFKQGTCDIDTLFVDSEYWFADWIRKNHERFLRKEDR